MWELGYKESWVPKNWCFWIAVLEKTLENPLDFKEIQPVHSKGDQSWVFIGSTDVEAEIPILWPPDAKSWLIGKKDSNAGKDGRLEEMGMIEDEMVGWHHWLKGHEVGLTLGVSDWQGGLACYSSWDCKESDTTEQLNWTENIQFQSTYYIHNVVTPPPSSSSRRVSLPPKEKPVPLKESLPSSPPSASGNHYPLPVSQICLFCVF